MRVELGCGSKIFQMIPPDEDPFVAFGRGSKVAAVASGQVDLTKAILISYLDWLQSTARTAKRWQLG